MIITTKINEAQKLVRVTKRPSFVLAQDSEFNRKILEYGKFDALVFPGKINRKLESNVNHVDGKFAAKNRIKIAYDLDKVRSLDKKERGIFLSKVKKDLQVLRKSKTEILLLNLKDKRDAQDFLISIGASTVQAKHATK